MTFLGCVQTFDCQCVSFQTGFFFGFVLFFCFACFSSRSTIPKTNRWRRSRPVCSPLSRYGNNRSYFLHLRKKKWPFDFGRTAAASWRTYLGETPPPCTSQPDILTAPRAPPLWRRRVAVTGKCCSSTGTHTLLFQSSFSFCRSEW